MDLLEIEKQSDSRVEERLAQSIKQELTKFDARTHKSLDIMPHLNDKMIFRQQGRRVSWGIHKAPYVAARHYPNAECAREIVDELARRGCKNVIKEGEEEE